MKSLQPSMRENTRYVKFKIHSEEKVEISEMVEAFWDATTGYMGVKELSDANPWIIGNKFDEEKQEGVIRVNREYVKDLRASLVLINSVASTEAFLSVEKVSGNISQL